jgi:hypothetical protein
LLIASQKIHLSSSERDCPSPFFAKEIVSMPRLSPFAPREPVAFYESIPLAAFYEIIKFDSSPNSLKSVTLIEYFIKTRYQPGMKGKLRRKKRQDILSSIPQLPFRKAQRGVRKEKLRRNQRKSPLQSRRNSAL